MLHQNFSTAEPREADTLPKTTNTTSTDPALPRDTVRRHTCSKNNHSTHADRPTVNLSPNYKNPGDTGSKQGAKITIDSTAKWNSDMWRTELIPQTKAPINQGTVFYHFSIKRSSTNVPSATNEHQIAFFESHFTELKYGWISGESGTSNTNL